MILIYTVYLRRDFTVYKPGDIGVYPLGDIGVYPLGDIGVFSVFFSLREKKTLAWSHFLAFFSFLSRKESVFTYGSFQNFHGKERVSRTLSNKFVTHGLKFFTYGNSRIFTEGILFSRKGFFLFLSYVKNLSRNMLKLVFFHLEAVCRFKKVK